MRGFGARYNEVFAMRYLRPILLSFGIGIGVGLLTHPYMAIIATVIMAPVLLMLDRIMFPMSDDRAEPFR